MWNDVNVCTKQANKCNSLNYWTFYIPLYKMLLFARSGAQDLCTSDRGFWETLKIDAVQISRSFFPTRWSQKSSQTWQCEDLCLLAHSSPVKDVLSFDRLQSCCCCCSSSSIGTTAHCGLWSVEQCPSIFFYLPPTLSIFSLPALEDLFLLPLSIFS